MSKRYTEPTTGMFEAAAALGYDSPLAAELADVRDDTRKVALAEECLECLDGRERSVLRALFGFETGDAMTEREAAEYLEMSQPTVNRTRREAIAKMKAEMGHRYV